MREIKFRGRHVRTDKWVYGYLIQSRGNYYIFPDDDGDWQDNEIVSESVGQFIGSKDKNRKAIYEGDVTQDIDDKSIQVIKYNKGRFSGTTAYANYQNNLLNSITIGNIYENPELLDHI